MCIFHHGDIAPDGIYYKVFKIENNKLQFAIMTSIFSDILSFFFGITIGLKVNKKYKSWRPGFHVFYDIDGAESFCSGPNEVIKKVKVSDCISNGTYCGYKAASFRYMTILED